MRRLASLCCVVVCACGGGSNTADAGFSEDAIHCGTGDDCDVITDTGCSDDTRCDVADVSPTCFQPVCVPPGTMQLGDACSQANSEGATTWDNCAVGLLCFQNVCRKPCDIGGSGAGCGSGGGTCMQDTDVGMLTIGVCM